jgi:hypothetical protein
VSARRFALRPSRGVLWLVVAFVLSLPAVTPRIYASDEVQYFAYLRSLWFDGDVSFENEYRWFYDAGIARSQNFHETFLERTTETGRRINFATLGCALLWAPFYGVADLAVRSGLVDGPADGFSASYVRAVAFASALYGFCALLLSIAAVRLIGVAWPALSNRGPLAAALTWIGTPLLFYMYVAPPMSHATSAFAVALFILIWLRVRSSWSMGGLAVLGAAAALMTMVREQDAFFAVGPVTDFARTQLRYRDPGWASRWGHALVGAAAAALVFTPQALAYLALNGRLGPSRLVARKMTWTAPHGFDVLASPAHGFFWWTPLALLAIAGLVMLWRHLPRGHRGIAASLGLMAAVQIYVAGSVESWTVAGAFGQRRFVALTAVLVIGLAAVLAAGARRGAMRVGLAAALAAACWWNVALVAQFGAGMMNRQRLELAGIAYNTFVVMPRALPELTWRYLFDRASFYEATRRLRDAQPR